MMDVATSPPPTMELTENGPWSLAEYWREKGSYAADCVLELRARVEALEAGATNESTSYCELNMPEQPSRLAFTPSVTNCHLIGPAPSPYESWSEWFETEGSKGVIHGIRMEALPFRSSAQQGIADAEAFGLTSASGSPVYRSAQSPSSSLVERVAGAMGPSSQAAMDAGELPYGTARAAIREVAAAAHVVCPFDPVENPAEHEGWNDMICWLEQEANR